MAEGTKKLKTMTRKPSVYKSREGAFPDEDTASAKTSQQTTPGGNELNGL